MRLSGSHLENDDVRAKRVGNLLAQIRHPCRGPRLQQRHVLAVVGHQVFDARRENLGFESARERCAGLRYWFRLQFKLDQISMA